MARYTTTLTLLFSLLWGLNLSYVYAMEQQQEGVVTVPPKVIVAYDFNQDMFPDMENGVSASALKAGKGSSVDMKQDQDRMVFFPNLMEARIDSDHYFEFTVTPEPSTSFNHLGFVATIRPGKGDIGAGLSIRSSIDGYATELGAVKIDDAEKSKPHEMIYLGHVFQGKQVLFCFFWGVVVLWFLVVSLSFIDLVHVKERLHSYDNLSLLLILSLSLFSVDNLPLLLSNPFSLHSFFFKS